jgi:hypothetical protein
MLMQEIHYVLYVRQLAYSVMVEPIQIVLNVRKILDIYTTNNVCRFVLMENGKIITLLCLFVLIVKQLVYIVLVV